MVIKNVKLSFTEEIELAEALRSRLKDFENLAQNGTFEILDRKVFLDNANRVKKVMDKLNIKYWYGGCMEIYDKNELELIVDSLTNYSVSLNKLRSNIENGLPGNDLDKFKDDITSIYSVSKEIECVNKLRDKSLFFLVNKDKDIKTNENSVICQENVK